MWLEPRGAGIGRATRLGNEVARGDKSGMGETEMSPAADKDSISSEPLGEGRQQAADRDAGRRN